RVARAPSAPPPPKARSCKRLRHAVGLPAGACREAHNVAHARSADAAGPCGIIALAPRRAALRGAGRRIRRSAAVASSTTGLGGATRAGLSRRASHELYGGWRTRRCGRRCALFGGPASGAARAADRRVPDAAGDRRVVIWSCILAQTAR